MGAGGYKAAGCGGAGLGGEGGGGVGEGQVVRGSKGRLGAKGRVGVGVRGRLKALCMGKNRTQVNQPTQLSNQNPTINQSTNQGRWGYTRQLGQGRGLGAGGRGRLGVGEARRRVEGCKAKVGQG